MANPTVLATRWLVTSIVLMGLQWGQSSLAQTYSQAHSQPQAHSQALALAHSQVLAQAHSQVLAQANSQAHSPLAGNWSDLTFDTLDPLAIAVLSRAQALSFQQNREYCGFIAYDDRGILRATRPVAGQKASCAPDAPDNWRLVASYHTHGAIDRRDPTASYELPSVNDMTGDIIDAVDGYVATPGGRLWFVEHAQGIAYQVGGPGSLPQDPRFRPSSCPPLYDYTLFQLREIEQGLYPPCKAKY